MMAHKIGIVGSESAKFTELGKQRAIEAIRGIIKLQEPTHIVSGRCHLGGIDIWAEELADELKISKNIFPPKHLRWEDGYKPRNIQIVNESDYLYCITVDKLPLDYTGMRFSHCYHCAKGVNGYKGEHVKSGGCWTVIRGITAGRQGLWIVIMNS